MESNSKNLKRLDVWLVDQGFAPSRTKAQELIDEGAVFQRDAKNPDRWLALSTASLKLPSDLAKTEIRVEAEEVLKYVSRGGRKLESAIQALSLSVQGQRVLDLGQSTGGFTDCVLQLGAVHVTGADVGSDQLDPRIKSNPRVTSYEKIHLKDLDSLPGFQSGFDLTVCDLSFISSLANLNLISKWSPRLLLLVKPQFELGPTALNKKGLVQKPELISDLRARFQNELVRLGFKMNAWIPSGLQGKDGNQEYFIYAEKS